MAARTARDNAIVMIFLVIFEFPSLAGPPANLPGFRDMSAKPKARTPCSDARDVSRSLEVTLRKEVHNRCVIYHSPVTGS